MRMSTKEDILSLAIHQMKEGGYDALNFREIAEDLDVSKANIHHHFQNKDTLAHHAVEAYTHRTLGAFQAFADESDGDILFFMKQMEEMFWKMSEEEGHCGVCVCEQIARVPHSPSILKEQSNRFSDHICQIVGQVVQRAAEQGRFKQGVKPEEISLLLILLFKGKMSYAQSFPSVQDARSAVGGVVSSWLETLLK